MKILIAFTAFVAMPVFANQWDVIAYECEQIATKKEPAKCKIEPGEFGPTLTLTVLAQPTDPKETRKRAHYVVGSTMYRFTSLGGRWITQQSRLKDGRKIERACSPIKGTQNRVACHDWKLSSWD